jgi:hypothetical protein
MTVPEEALQRARDEAAQMRTAGAYAEARGEIDVRPPDSVSLAKLYEWAMIEPDLRDVRSTRRYGAPMTAFKHGLLRLLAQYHGALIAEQTRFNVNLVAHLARLEGRIEALEKRDEQP